MTKRVRPVEEGERTNSIPPALKHGLYSGMTVLPQEDRAEFEEFRRSVFAEYEPNGPTEEEIVQEMSRLLWRKRNLVTYRMAEKATRTHLSILERLTPSRGLDPILHGLTPSPEEEKERRELREYADQQARTELGPWFDLVEIGHVATTDHLLNEFAMIERINSMVDRCLKRLLMVRGIKSISRPSSKDGA
jgi:hypothetical protein